MDMASAMVSIHGRDEVCNPSRGLAGQLQLGGVRSWVRGRKSKYSAIGKICGSPEVSVTQSEKVAASSNLRKVFLKVLGEGDGGRG